MMLLGIYEQVWSWRVYHYHWI